MQDYLKPEKHVATPKEHFNMQAGIKPKSRNTFKHKITIKYFKQVNVSMICNSQDTQAKSRE